MTRDYSILSNEDLILAIRDGDEAAYGQLFENIKPGMYRLASQYSGSAMGMDMDDFIQEGCILAWTIVKDGKYKDGSFFNYFYSAYRHKLANLFWAYRIKNPMVETSRQEENPELGYSIVSFVEARELEEHREKTRRACRECYHRKKERENEARRAAGLPVKEKLTPEQRTAKKRQQAMDYYYRNKERLNKERAEKRRAKKEAERVAAMGGPGYIAAMA